MPSVELGEFPDRPLDYLYYNVSSNDIYRESKEEVIIVKKVGCIMVTRHRSFTGKFTEKFADQLLDKSSQRNSPNRRLRKEMVSAPPPMNRRSSSSSMNDSLNVDVNASPTTNHTRDLLDKFDKDVMTLNKKERSPSGHGRGSRADSINRALSNVSCDDNIEDENDDTLKTKTANRPIAMALMLAVILLTIHSVYHIYHVYHDHINSDHDDHDIDILTVWCAGWITAACTALGTLPFFMIKNLNEEYVAYANAFAGGMMIAASSGLIIESLLMPADRDAYFPPTSRLLVGLVSGVLFIRSSQHLLDEYEDSNNMFDLQGLSAKRVLIVMAVMTLHSFSEGVGIGVSYHSQKLGGFISATLAVHNIPEGLAISIVLIPRGFSLLHCMLWCVFSSLPQPLMAVPSYLFVEVFQPLLIIGFGFAAGAMMWVALFELLADALKSISFLQTVSISTVACILMASTQFYMH